MVDAEFSEFTFGFAFAREVVERSWPAAGHAPRFPSLRQEAGLGYDFSLALPGYLYFAQFKRAAYLSTARAAFWVEHGNRPYYRFSLAKRRSTSSHGSIHQHTALLRLAAQHWFHIVEYVAPRFHTNRALSHAYRRQQVVDRSIRIDVNRIGWLDENETHHVTYTTRAGPTVRSEPRFLDEPYNAGDLTTLSRADLGQPVPLTQETFRSVAEAMAELATEIYEADDVGPIDSQDDPFGQAVTIGRILFGGELIPIPSGPEPEL